MFCVGHEEFSLEIQQLYPTVNESFQISKTELKFVQFLHLFFILKFTEIFQHCKQLFFLFFFFRLDIRSKNLFPIGQCFSNCDAMDLCGLAQGPQSPLIHGHYVCCKTSFIITCILMNLTTVVLPF